MSKRTVCEEFGVISVGDREVGIEIEVEGRNLPQILGRGWTTHTDGSLRGESYEYVMDQPVLRENVGVSLSNLRKMLMDYSADISESERAGVHVHINVQPFTFKETLNFVLLYLVVEELLVKFCGPEREGNLFCLRASDAEYLLTGMVDSVQRHSFRRMQSEEYRYASLNMTALRKYGSVEFRAMRSTSDFDIIATWANMLLKLKDMSLLFNHPRQIVESVSEEGADRFIGRILGEYGELVQCPDMGNILFEGIRRIQHIAYSFKEGEDVVEEEDPERPSTIMSGGNLYDITYNHDGIPSYTRGNNPPPPPSDPGPQRLDLGSRTAAVAGQIETPPTIWTTIDPEAIPTAESRPAMDVLIEVERATRRRRRRNRHE